MGKNSGAYGMDENNVDLYTIFSTYIYKTSERFFLKKLELVGEEPKKLCRLETK